ncbi:F-box/kelch-repeat protein OR23-like [Cynara cardunculus var. scolymus]|uniref:F-box domain, cyclin-like protein n=1 Tax=Cynara cardunculus var. scolymus TaxID=59895 RepID=A0A103YNK2_CYNCS|nr:F-box/kelch-repeat protein OR23-like [Cynara cardunculus var. scolymus]KVI12384.1 F-box domain, cyclin-like protein [Cynara cardunculus var. scolymus]
MEVNDLWVMSPPLSSPPFSSDEEFQSENLTLTLIPGLPDDLAALILSFVPFSHHNRLRSTCKLWKNFFSSKTLISIRRKHLHSSHLSHLLCIFSDDPTISSPYLFDPQNLAWCQLPPLPCNPHVYGLCNFTSISHDSHLYVLGGSLFDTRSFPLDRPSPSSSAFRFDFTTQGWESLSPMLSPRGSFACASIPKSDRIIVAGGGSRHTMFGAAGSRMSSVEMYDIATDEWTALDGLPRFRAGCVGFMVGNEADNKEFWVMGGYGESRTVLGVFPVDEYYRDAVVMDLKNGGVGKWRELGDMWEEGERRRLGRIAVIEDINGGSPSVFMLDKSDIFRYDMASNCWKYETSIPKKLTDESSTGFIALDGELHVMGSINGGDTTDNNWKSRQQKRSASLFFQIYHPQKKVWRTLVNKPPFPQSLDFKTAVLCTIRI